MEIVYFTLGAVTVLLVIGVAIMIRIGILVRTLQEDLRDHERGKFGIINANKPSHNMPVVLY